ncbi:putative protein SMG7L-like [Capsicum annuum]|nr:putative protein SMG7L-like [Capsicum annuum]
MAFIKGRQIIDAVLIASECVDTRLKRGDPGIMCKLGIEKAYGHVNWGFLIKMLKQMGFGEKWLKWIEFCIKTVRFSILVNGEPASFFPSERGLRQGDPLSPFLFILAMEGYNSIMRVAIRNQWIRGFKVGNFAWEEIRFLNDWEIEKVAELLKVLNGCTGLSEEEDSIKWRHNIDGMLSVNRLYTREVKELQGCRIRPWKKIWKTKIPTKIKCFSWCYTDRMDHARTYIRPPELLDQKRREQNSKEVVEHNTIMHLVVYLEGKKQQYDVHYGSLNDESGNNRYLQQASHQGWPSVDVLPNVAVQTLDELGFSASASSSDFFRMLTEADSSVKDAGMLGDANKGALENLPAEQQIIAPMGGIMRSSGKQPAVEEQINQLGVQFLKKRGRKRKTPLSSLAPAGKEKATVAGFSALAHAQAGFAAFAHTQAERKDNFKEVSSLHTNYNKLLCCHINSKGELLATAGHDGKVLIWELENNNVYSGEGHAHHVTDIRFRPNSTLFATSSFDRTVKIWDAAKPSNPFQNLVGHIEHVMSVDFHPRNAGLLSSCDSNDDIILWDVTKGDRKLIFKGGSRQVRFQPRHGDFLASSIGNMINIFDVETNNIQKQLQGHIKDVRSICWDGSGNYLASVSEDSARIWSVSEGKCLHELCSSGNKFQSCTFHPGYAQVLVIGSFEFLELWNPFFQSNITRPYSAHAGIISSLADSPSKGTIASVSHDQWIKIWR